MVGNTQSIAALRPELWAKELFADVMDSLYFTEQGLMGEGDNNIVQVMTDLSKEKGDTKTFGLTAKLSGNGVTGDNELEGNEEQISAYSESIVIDQIRNAVRLEGKLDEQMNSYNMRTDAKNKLSIWMQEFIERQIFLKMGGVTNTSLNDVGGTVIGARAAWSNSSTVIPAATELAGSGSRYLCANYASGGGGTTALTTAHIMTPQLITMAKTKAMLANPKIQPLKVNGKNHYCLFVHPLQADDLRNNSTFHTAMKDAEVRGKENPIFTGALGIWHGVIIYEHEYVPFLDVSVAGNSFQGAATGTDCAVDCFRALLCGKQAVGFLQAKNPKGWVEETFDYANETGFATSLIGGIDKIMFNSKEYGVIAIDTATQQPY